MKTLLTSVAAGGATLAALALFLTGAHVDAVSSASYFYTNASRTGWHYPKNNSYTSEVFVGVQQSIPIVYAGENQDSVCTWVQTPGLGGTFVPANSSLSSYRWTPSSIGAFTSTLKVQKPGGTDGYGQTFYFMVVPEPALGIGLIAGMAILGLRCRMRTTRSNVTL